MSVRLFCIDGTNLVRTAYGYGGPAHQAQEQADAERLVGIFERLCRDAGPAVEVEVFFDGAFRVMPSLDSANFRVRFTREFTADEMILDRVRSRSWSGGGSVTVVTADGDLGRSAQAEGGRWMRIEHGTAPEAVAGKIGGRFLR